jgi:hypothetical protein
MNGEQEVAERFLSRLEYAAMRLQQHASGAPARGLTDPDKPSGEQWEWGQVWAHLAEFVPYWMAQTSQVIGSASSDPAPFGRTKTDSERVAAIERDRNRPALELWARLQDQLGELRRFLEDLPPQAWSKEGRHPTLGTMAVSQMVEEFLVGHLEEHASQLDGLAARGG